MSPPPEVGLERVFIVWIGVQARPLNSGRRHTHSVPDFRDQHGMTADVERLLSAEVGIRPETGDWRPETGERRPKPPDGESGVSR
ncbi:hypothetical protein GCM10027562_41980 [Arthrobacter pigmenti]